MAATSTAFILNVDKGFNPNRKDEVRTSLFKQYERIVFESLITTFGLDVFIKDQHGGDVDTIHNVRKIGHDEKMYYKDAANRTAYEQRGAYDSYLYHRDPGYIAKNKEISEAKRSGNLYDGYTGDRIAPNGKTDLDHIIAAKEIHEDRGRVLAGITGEQLANSPENLIPTNPHTNRSKRADSMEEYLERRGYEYTDDQKQRMRDVDAKARNAYEAKLSAAYYSSPTFWQNTALACGSVGVQMGLRQAMGFVLAEIWFAVREKFIGTCGSTFKGMLKNVAEGVKEGIRRVKEKYKEIVARFSEGALSGILSSLCTTLCNIFFSTAKSAVRIIRQSFSSLVAAGKILFFNPDNLRFGDRMLAALKILATGASAVVGILLSEALTSTGLGAFPVVGELLCTFSGIFATGVLSCTLLYALDSCETVQRVIKWLNSIPTIDDTINFYRQQANLFEKKLAELEKYDLEEFRREVAQFKNAAKRIDEVKDDPRKLNAALDIILRELGINLPYEGDFDTFMSNRHNRLVFKRR